LSACFFVLASGRPPVSPLFPYTTLFRSDFRRGQEFGSQFYHFVPYKFQVYAYRHFFMENGRCQSVAVGKGNIPTIVHGMGFSVRSEEHTSELQSRENLVCRLLLEKQKKN